MQAPKNGFFYVLDRTTGKLISAKNYVPVNWATGIDMKTGRPVENPAARYGKVPVLVSPGAGRGAQLEPDGLQPADRPGLFPGQRDLHGLRRGRQLRPRRIPASAPASRGYDAEREEDRRTTPTRTRAAGCSALRSGDADRKSGARPTSRTAAAGCWRPPAISCSRATSPPPSPPIAPTPAQKFWQMPVQQVPIAAPITYMVDGVQYIAVNAGWGGGLAHVERSNYSQAVHRQAAPAGVQARRHRQAAADAQGIGRGARAGAAAEA